MRRVAKSNIAGGGLIPANNREPYNDTPVHQHHSLGSELPWRETSSRYGDTDKPQLLSTLILEFSKVSEQVTSL
ncbi:hypothetical protein GOODEAATRI_021874 [Goodea atripinnis]|uniref:Uncharacterized protein n=1 Tax=Goodea atripinnis TaxID=208336 RepID=A0ABV0PQM1_9TELE